jgi:prevent-host-death family protein
MQVNILDAKNRLSELIRSVRKGKEVVIANRGEPVARLVPVGTDSGDEAHDLVRWLKEHPLPPHLQRSAAEIESAVNDERGAWD